jgi:hypothetical protein
MTQILPECTKSQFKRKDMSISQRKFVMSYTGKSMHSKGSADVKKNQQNDKIIGLISFL